jgi:hypothetical protein
MRVPSAVWCAIWFTATAGSATAWAQTSPAVLPFPPRLPDGKTVLSHTGDEFLKPSATLLKGVQVAEAAPTVDFVYFPGQDYQGKPWSNWGDSLAVNGKYYASIGDHLAVGGPGAGANGTGTGRVFEYDPQAKSFRQLLDTTTLLNLPTGHYTPGKIHSRLDIGTDGWLYCATHRGSTTVTADKNRYEGDWVLRCNPTTGESEVVVRGPVPKHCIPCSVLDGERMIFYGGTAAGTDAREQGVQFFAYDLTAKKLLYREPDGPARYMILAKSTGRVYWTPGQEDGVGPLVRYDPAKGGGPVKIGAEIGLRAATQETKGGKVFTVSKGTKGGEATLFAFDTKTETAEPLGPAAVGVNTYITSLDVDPTGRYVYYIPGAHGGSEKDHSAVVQFDTRTKRRKVIAFLHPFLHAKTGATLVGTFSSAVDPTGDKLYVTWNVSRGGKSWDCCALTVIHIPESERQ